MPEPESTPDPPLEAFLAGRDIPCPKCGYNLRGLRLARCPECRYPLELMLRPRGGWVSTREGGFAMCTFFAAVAITLAAQIHHWMGLRQVSFIESIPQPQLVLMVCGIVVLAVFGLTRLQAPAKRPHVGRFAVMTSAGIFAGLASCILALWIIGAL
jgi:hypothetical protein